MIVQPELVSDPVLEDYWQMIAKLHEKWRPHPGQAHIIYAMFGEKIREVFAECGRNFGKTEIISYCLNRNAQSCPGSPNYYFAPYAKQAREIIWEPERLQKVAPAEWIEGKNETEMRLSFTNGSFIKCDGSDNTESYRGVKVTGGGLVVFDEFKDFKPAFWVAMEPNLIDAKLLIVGTPPELDGQFTEVADQFKKDVTRKYFNLPSSCNTFLRPGFLARKKAELYAKGEGDIWEREYEAKRIKGGKNAIFPMIHSYKTTPHGELIEEIRRDRHKLEWYTITDPGTSTCHASLFIALNRYNRTVYFLDEIYETSQAETSTRLIGHRILEKQKALPQTDRDEKPVEFMNVADEAAAWYINEVNDRFEDRLVYVATEKAAIGKEKGLSLVKDALLQQKFKFSDRCIKLRWEMENYIKDDKGKIPKANDHLIDCLRYFLQAAAYTLELEREPLREVDREDFRGASPQQDFHEYFEDGEI